MKKITLLLVLIGSFNAFSQVGEFEVTVPRCGEQAYSEGRMLIKNELEKRRREGSCLDNLFYLLKHRAISFKEDGFDMPCNSLTVTTTFFCHRFSW